MSLACRRIPPRLFHRLTTTTQLQNPSTTNVSNASTSTVSKNIEVWITTCIVTNFGSAAAATTITNHPAASPSNDDDSYGFRILINPSNPGLTGCRNFPYFPRGGAIVVVENGGNDSQQTGAGGSSSTWGGMEAGSDLLFPAQTVDGLVHLHVGARSTDGGGLASLHHPEDERTTATTTKIGPHQLAAGRNHGRQPQPAVLTAGGGGVCPVGHAVVTSAAGQLTEWYHAIVHTSTPNYSYQNHHHHHQRQHHNGDPDMIRTTTNDHDHDHDKDKEAQQLLAQCYTSSLQQGMGATIAHPNHQTYRRILLATPLLGAGCRGFPVSLACTIAARAAISWWKNDDQNNGDTHDCNTKRAPTATINPPPYTSSSRNITLAFGLLEEATAVQLVRELQEADQQWSGTNAMV